MSDSRERDHRSEHRRDGGEGRDERRRPSGSGRPQRSGRSERSERPHRGERGQDGDRRRTGNGGKRGFGSRAGGDRRRDDERRGSRPGRPQHDGGKGRFEHTERVKPAHNPKDLRASNRVDQGRSPDIDEDVTGKELDRATLKQVQGLDEKQAGWVSKHLVMAGRLMYDDPVEAFQHALAASRRGGRLACVREAVALTAYAAGEWQEALREFRTYRRITGDDTHVAAQLDCERALGRPEKAVQLASEVDMAKLDRDARVELVMVLSGAHEDIGDLEGARTVLEIPELDRRRGYPFSPRLFQRYADVLSALGREKEARQWEHYVRVAEKALGMGSYADPDIVDIDNGPSEEERAERRAAREAERAARAEQEAAAAAQDATADQGVDEEDGLAASSQDGLAGSSEEDSPAPSDEDDVVAEAGEEAVSASDADVDEDPASVQDGSADPSKRD